MKRRPIFYWVTAADTPEGVEMWWVPSRRQWFTQPEALAICAGSTQPCAWALPCAKTLRRAKWIAQRSPTGATIRVSTTFGKRWVFPAREVQA